MASCICVNCGAVVHRRLPGLGHFAEERRKVGGGGWRSASAPPSSITVLEVAGGQRVGEVLGLQPQQVHVVVEGLAGDREAHAAQVRHTSGRGREAGGAQPAADLVGLVEHRAQPELHQFVRGDQPGQPGAHDSDLSAVQLRRDRTQAVRVGQVVVVAEREVRVQHGDRGLARRSGPGQAGRSGGRAGRVGGRQFGGGGHEISAFSSWCCWWLLAGWRPDSSRYSSWPSAATLEFLRP